jgi:hypothetical protein
MKAGTMEHYSLFLLLTKVTFFFKATLMDWQNLLVTVVAYISLNIDGIGSLPKEVVPFAAILFIGIGIWNRFHESQKAKHESDLQRELAREAKIKNDRAEHELEELKKLNNNKKSKDEEE